MFLIMLKILLLLLMFFWNCSWQVYRNTIDCWELILVLLFSGLRSYLKTLCYLLNPENLTKSCKSKGLGLCVHLKSTSKTFQAIKGMHVQKATKKEVPLKKQYVPLCHSQGASRCAQTKQEGLDASSVTHRVLASCCTCIKVQSLVLNYYLHVDSLVIEHFLVQKHLRCRTYRAHCWIHPYMSVLCHTGPILGEKEQTLPKVDVAQKKLKKQKFVTHG